MVGFGAGIGARCGARRRRRSALLGGLLLAWEPRAAAARDTEACILDPAPGGRLFITPPGVENPPNFLKLCRVTYADTFEAASYAVEFIGPTPFATTVTHAVVGDAVVTTLLLPPHVFPGPYQMRCAGFDEVGVRDWRLRRRRFRSTPR